MELFGFVFPSWGYVLWYAAMGYSAANRLLVEYLTAKKKLSVKIVNRIRTFGLVDDGFVVDFCFGVQGILGIVGVVVASGVAVDHFAKLRFF